jgi:hypothetical protein
MLSWRLLSSGRQEFPTAMRPGATIVAALLALAALPARAERDPLTGAPLPPGQKRDIPSPITDRFYARGIFYSPAISTSVRVDSNTGPPGMPTTPGTLVSGEKDLGMKARQPQGQIELMFRLRKRSKMRLNFFESSRAGNRLLTRTILFGNETFNIGDQASSSLDFRSFNLTYTYSFIRTDRVEIGAGLAAHFIEADAMGGVPARHVQQEVSGAGAFPTIPLDFAWRISRRFALTARGQYFRASVNGFQGSLGDYHADVQYRWLPNFALGAGYSLTRVSLDVNDANFPGIFRMYVRGPEAFFRVSF